MGRWRQEKQMMDNSELHILISAKLCPAVVERVRSHLHEVGGSSSSSLLRDERGYTVLHAIAAYHRDSDGREGSCDTDHPACGGRD